MKMSATKNKLCYALVDKTKIFAQQTTIHGVPRVAAANIHVSERIFWISIIITATYGAVSVSLQNLNRYYANPTVVSLKKDFRNWYNPFPSATCCFVDKADEYLIDDFMEVVWGLNDSDPKYDYYRNFVMVVANASFETLQNFEPFKDDEKLNQMDFVEIAAKVHPELTGTLVTFDTKKKTTWTLIMTEMGICYSVNTKFAKHFKYNKEPDVNASSVENNEKILSCHYLNGLCYARYDSDPLLPLKIYIHSYLDILHATSEPPLYVKESQELEINYRMQETSAGENLRSLSPAQRRCRFDDEPLGADISAYSTSICYMTCRYKIIKQLCGCKPFFYQNFPGKSCDIKGLLCVAKHVEHITKSPIKLGCDCPEPCELITYIAQVPKITVWEYGYFDQRITFRWGLLPPTTKYHRDILFGFEDLVVSIGGSLALFLGVSFISGIELIYFLSELFHYLVCSRKNTIVPVDVKNKEIKHNNKIQKKKKKKSNEFCPDCMLYMNVRSISKEVIYPICSKHMSYRKKERELPIPYCN